MNRYRSPLRDLSTLQIMIFTSGNRVKNGKPIVESDGLAELLKTYQTDKSSTAIAEMMQKNMDDTGFFGFIASPHFPERKVALYQVRRGTEPTNMDLVVRSLKMVEEFVTQWELHAVGIEAPGLRVMDPGYHQVSQVANAYPDWYWYYPIAYEPLDPGWYPEAGHPFAVIAKAQTGEDLVAALARAARVPAEQVQEEYEVLFNGKLGVTWEARLQQALAIRAAIAMKSKGLPVDMARTNAWHYSRNAWAHLCKTEKAKNPNPVLVSQGF